MAGRVIAVDPGIRGCGVAVFDWSSGAVYSELAKAEYVRNSSVPDAPARALAAVLMAYAVMTAVGPVREDDQVVLEWPRVYWSRIRSGAARGDPNDLLPLAAVCGALATRGVPHCYAPSEWKGQLPKDVCRGRVRARLNAAEREVLDAAERAAGKSLAHNVADAVGLGLHHLGRWAR